MAIPANSNVLKNKTELCVGQRKLVGETFSSRPPVCVTCVLEAGGPGVRFQCGHWLRESQLNQQCCAFPIQLKSGLCQKDPLLNQAPPWTLWISPPSSVCDPSLETAGVHQRCKPGPAYERWVKGEEEMGFQSVLPLTEEPNVHGGHDAINFLGQKGNLCVQKRVKKEKPEATHPKCLTTPQAHAL